MALTRGSFICIIGGINTWKTRETCLRIEPVFNVYSTWHRGGGPRVVVSTDAFHARVRCSVPGLGGLKETKMFLPHPRVKVSIVGSLRDREVACSASDRQGSNFESCVWRAVPSQSSHHPQEVLLAQFSLYVPGLGRVLDKSTRVQVQVLEKMTSTSTSTSTGFSKVLEYKYKYFEKYLSTSTEYFRCKL